MSHSSTQQIDWLVAASWAAALIFCAACFYMLVRLIEWAA